MRPFLSRNINRAFTRQLRTRRSHQRQVQVDFWRGGTSNGLLINGENLPEWRTIWNQSKQNGHLSTKQCEADLEEFFQAAMGSPDPYGRQLNGMGGGVSSLSKAVIVEKATSSEADIDYMFVQIGIKDGKLDLAGNCGNMTSAVAPFALNQGLVNTVSLIDLSSGKSLRSKHDEKQYKAYPLTVRLKNLNTNKRIDAQIQALHDEDDDDSSFAFLEQGDYLLDGVPGLSSSITLSFQSPAGSKTDCAMPTRNPVDEIKTTGRTIKASLLDISNPGVFIDGRAVSWNPARRPEELTANTEVMSNLESIRCEGARLMGLDPRVPSVPKIVLLYPPTRDDVDITCQALSMEQAHKAVPVTLALNLGVACKLEGTIAHTLARQRDPQNTVIGHPSGKIEVGADIRAGKVVAAKLVRTARCLMQGVVNAGSRPLTMID